MDNEQTAKPIAELLPKTLEMLVSAPAPRIMPPAWPSEQERKWLDKWIGLQTNPILPEAAKSKLRNLEFQVYDFCREYSKHPGQGRRLLIYGGFGSGKSHVARKVKHWAQRIALKLPLTHIENEEGDEFQLSTVQFMFWPGVVDAFKRGEWDTIEEAVRQSMVILDDIGAEHDPSGVAKEKLFYILERRVEKWMLMTTNISPPDWDNKFERRIASRFLRNSTIVDLNDVLDFCA